MSDFYTIPINFKLPGIFAEFNNSKAQTSLGGLPHKILLLGHKTTDGTAKTEQAILVPNGKQAELFGKNSILHHMLDTSFAINPYQEVYALPIEEDSEGAAAKWELDFTGCNLADNNNVALYLYGKRVSISLEAGNANAAAQKVKKALDDAEDLPITNISLEDNTAKLTFEFIHKGNFANQEAPHFNRTSYEQDPAGFTCNISLKQAGSGTINAVNLVAKLGDQWWSEIVNPFSRDITLLDALNDVLTQRDGGTVQKPGMQYLARKDIYSALITFAETRNHRFETILGLHESATPEYLIVAIYAAHVVKETSNDPARVLQYIPLMGIAPAKNAEGFTDTERNQLIQKGIATTREQGNVMLERAITSYKKNDAGATDNSYTDLEVFYILNLLRYQMNQRLLLRYPRVKIGNDSDMLRPNTVRPKDIKAELLALAQEWVTAGLINSIDAFRQHLKINHSANDNGRIEITLQPELIGQLRQIFVSIQFLR